MIKVESGSFAALVRSYKKSLNMLAVLQHICEDNSVELSMLPDEVCELINLDPAEIEKQRLSGRLRFAEEENGTRHYSIVDIINLKDSIDWKVINRQVESLSFEEELNDGMAFFLTDKVWPAGRIYPDAAIPLSFPEKRLFAADCGSAASGVAAMCRRKLRIFFSARLTGRQFSIGGRALLSVTVPVRHPFRLHARLSALWQAVFSGSAWQALHSAV